MAVLSSLLSYLGTKGVAAAGAATLMVGGGVAVAQTSGLDLAHERVPEEVELPVADDRDETEAETEADAGTLAEEPTSEDDPIGSLEVEECPTDDPDCEPEPIDDECDEDVLSEDASTDEEITSDADCRSETAKRVHEALTGGAVDANGDPIVPGHPDFGATVSGRASSKNPGVHLGREVSEAARGGEAEPEDEEIEELSSQESSSPTEDDEADEGAGKPAWAGQPGGPNGRPRG